MALLGLSLQGATLYMLYEQQRAVSAIQIKADQTATRLNELSESMKALSAQLKPGQKPPEPQTGPTIEEVE